MHLRRLAIVALVVGFLALLTYGLLSKGTDDRIDQALASGRAPEAPHFSLEALEPGTVPPNLARSVGTALSGNRVALSDLQGVPVVLNLWASWCTPCRQEAPVLQRSWREHGPKGVLFLGLDIQDLRGQARDFVRKNGATYPSVREPERDVANTYGATGIPETYFIDSSGHVVAHARGPVDASELAAGVKAARTGRVTMLR